MSDDIKIDRQRFTKNLDHWRNIVHHVLRKGHAPRGVTQERYILIHRELLEFVEQPSLGEPTPMDQLRQSLHHMVRPWVNLETLCHSDKRVLRMLENDVDEIVRSKFKRPLTRGQLFFRIFALTLALILAGITIRLLTSSDAPSVVVADGVTQVWENLQGIKARFIHGIAQSSTNQRLTVLAGSIVVLGMFFLRNPKRF